MKKPPILPLSSIEKNNIAIVGGKAAMLGKLLQNNIPAPHGFVLTTHAHDFFLAEKGMQEYVQDILTEVAQKRRGISRASAHIRTNILENGLPNALRDMLSRVAKDFPGNTLAVRSSATVEDSATHSWAGQFDSFLHVSTGMLEQQVLLCIASLYNERALWYADAHGISHTGMKMAVILQEMIPAQWSGVAFTMHPVTGNRDVVYIELVKKDPDGLVSGSVTPYSMLIHKKTGGMDERSTQEIRGWKSITEHIQDSLLPLLHIVEELLGHPCDVEWVYTNDQFYLVQVRPITAQGSLLK